MEGQRTPALNLSHVPILPMGIQARVTPKTTLSITRIPPVIQNPAAGLFLAHHVPWTPVHLWLTPAACPEILWIPLACSRLRDRKPNRAMQWCLLRHRRVTTWTNLGICCKIWHDRTLPGIGICRLRNHWHKWNLAHTGCSLLSHWCHDIRCTTVWPEPTTCTIKLKVIRTSRRCAPKPKWTTLRGIGRMQAGVSWDTGDRQDIILTIIYRPLAVPSSSNDHVNGCPLQTHIYWFTNYKTSILHSRCITPTTICNYILSLRHLSTWHVSSKPLPYRLYLLFPSIWANLWPRS